MGALYPVDITPVNTSGEKQEVSYRAISLGPAVSRANQKVGGQLRSCLQSQTPFHPTAIWIQNKEENRKPR